MHDGLNPSRVRLVDLPLWILELTRDLDFGERTHA